MRLVSHLRSNKTFRHRLILFSIFMVGILAFALITFVNHRIIGSDDTIFQEQIIPYHNVFEWVQYRYENWSGRIFSEAFIYLLSPAPFYIWQIITILMYGLFVTMLFLYYRLFSSRHSDIKDYFMLGFCVISLFLLHIAVISDGILWMTGSIVYFWMTSFGLVALYPIIYLVFRGKLPRWPITTLGALSGIVAVTSQEQVGALLVGLMFVFLIYSLLKMRLKKNNFPWYLSIMTTLFTILFVVSIHAPGNALRLELELVRWLPDFYSTPLVERVQASYRWFLDAIINHSGYLLIVSWFSMAALFLVKAKKVFSDYIFIMLLIATGTLSLTKGSDTMSYLFEFYATWHPDITNSVIALNVIPWLIMLAVTVCAPLFLFRKKAIGWMISILFLAAFAATGLMVLSPTMYASSWRSLFVPSIVLLFVVCLLLDRLIDAYAKHRFALIVTVSVLALSQYTYEFARLLKQS